MPSLPTNQTYNSGRFDAPMYAESDDENFQFHNLCGVLHFALKGQSCSVKSIVVEAVDEVVFGSFSVSNGKDIHMTPTSYSNKVTLQGTSNVPLNSETATDFYIYLPPQTYKAGMTFTINRSDGTKYVKTTTKDFAVERNNIYTFNWDVTSTSGTSKATINGREVDVPWVQLWENGPRFAKYNVGVTDGKESSIGGYYSWGGYTNKESHNYLNGVNGILVTGKGDLSQNSIFLPFTGYYDYDDNLKLVFPNQGYYWTATLQSYKYDSAYYIYLYEQASVSHGLVYYPRCVRAVLNE